MKQYQKNIDGKIVKKYANEIVIIKDDMATYAPTVDMILADGGEEYVVPEPTEEELLQRAKKGIIDSVKEYDSSDSINEFYIQDISVGLDKATRAGLKLRFEAELSMGLENTTLWYNDIQFPLAIQNAIKMLYAIEVYASACYDNTQYHISEINKLDNIEDVENYDYTLGYPEKLHF